MDFQQALDELQRAADICSDPTVPPAQRATAEAVILNFHKSKDSIDLCKFILERTSSEQLRFDAAQVLRDNLMAGWDRIGGTEIPTLLAQQLVNLMFNSNISYAVGRRLASVVAIIVKHQAVEHNGQERKQLVHHLLNTLSNTGHPFLVATTILESLIAEHQFVSVSLKTDHIFTFEAHFAAKKHFENEELSLIFERCLQFLNTYQGGRENEFERILRIVETVLFWCFTNTNLPQRIVVVIENDVNPVFKPPPSWQRITSLAFENVFFDLHMKLRHSENETLVSRTLQFLSQIFSMSGPLFNGRNARVALLGRLLPRFITILELPDNKKSAILGLSDIVRKILLFHRMSTLNALEASLLENFFWAVGRFTCQTVEASVGEETKRFVEDRVLRESTTRLLEAWTNVLAEPDVVPACVLPISEIVFSTYIRGKLSPPLGSRLPGDDDDDDDEGTDDIRFRDQLQSLGLFGRAVVSKSADLLINILNPLLVQLDALFISSVGNASDIFEDLHWALLIAGHFLAYESEGETNLIPKEIVQYSLQASGDPQASVQCIENGLSLRPLPDGNIDPVIRLISVLLSLGEYERRMAAAGFTEYLSPEVTKNILSILSRIAGIYYLYSDQYAQMSDSFRAVWGKDSRVGSTFLDFLLTTVLHHLGFGGEVSVQSSAVDLLASLTNTEEKARRALTSSEFGPLVQLLNSIGPERRDLPCDIYQKALKSLMTVGNLCATEYWDQILNPLCLRFTNFMNITPAEKHREDARLELTFLLSGHIGVASSAHPRVAADLFLRIVPLRLHVASIICAFYNYTDIVQLCIKFMTEICKRFLSFLTLGHALEVYQEALNVAKMYALHAYGRVSAEKGAEDDKIMDLMLLFDMMTSLLTKDLFDLSPDTTDCEGTKEPPRVTGSSMSVNCLAIILPLLTKDLFDYPEFGDKYFRLISYLSELDAAAVFNINTHVFNHLMETVSLALKTSNADQFNHCCDFITSVANFISRNNMQGSENSELVKSFLGVFFNMTLTMTISKDSLPSISSVTFALISAFKEMYEGIGNEIICSREDRRDVLHGAFEGLIAGLNMGAGGDRQSRLQFRHRLEHFIHTVRSILES